MQETTSETTQDGKQESKREVRQETQQNTNQKTTQRPHKHEIHAKLSEDSKIKPVPLCQLLLATTPIIYAMQTHPR